MAPLYGQGEGFYCRYEGENSQRYLEEYGLQTECVSRGGGATRGAESKRGGEDQEETEDPEAKRTKGEARECMAEKAELCRKEKLRGRRGLSRVGSERY